MNDVELTGLGLGQVNALLRHDAQTGIFKLRVNFASEVAGGGVGLDDRKCTFDGHECRPSLHGTPHAHR